MSTSAAIDDELHDLTSLDKVQLPGVGDILCVVTQIVAILGNFPCDAPGAEECGHQFLIFSTKLWLTLKGIDAEVVANKPAQFAGTTHTDRFIYDAAMETCTEKERHKKGAIRMIKHVFPPAAFLDLQNAQGLMIGKTPIQIMAHL